MREVVNLLVIVAIGVIIANMISSANVKGTTALFCNIQNLWGVSVNGMLGKPYKTKTC